MDKHIMDILNNTGIDLRRKHIRDLLNITWIDYRDKYIKDLKKKYKKDLQYGELKIPKIKFPNMFT